MTWLRTSLSALSLAAFTGLVTPGCQKNESMLYILGILAIDRTDCTAKAEPGSLVLVHGVIDRALRPSLGYQASVLVGSHLTQRGSREQLRTETAIIALRGAEVTLETVGGQRMQLHNGDGDSIPNPYSTIGTGTIGAASGTQAGLGSTSVTIVPAGLVVPDGTIVSRIRVFGDTLGGQEIESNEYIFPIEICDGCLISYPSTAADESAAAGTYLCKTSGTDQSAQSVCSLGQDSAISCSICAASNAICRDPCLNCSVLPPEGCTNRPCPAP